MQRRRRGQWAGVLILLLLTGLAGGCASGPASVASTDAAGAAAPAVLTGAALLVDGDAPRLLFSGSGPLTPTVFSRDGQTRVVVDLADAVVAAGMEPPRADGKIVTKVEMRSFTELGRPHVQFELVSSTPVAPRIAGDSGSSGTAVYLDRPALPTAVASVPEPVAVPLPEPPAVVSENRASAPPAASPSVSAPPPAADLAPVPVRHPAAGRPATRLSSVGTKPQGSALTITLSGDGAFAYDTFALANPPRFVVDLPGVVNAAGKKSQDLRSASVSRVRVSQFRGGPDPVTRVVFDLAGEGIEPAIAASAGGLALTFRSETKAARAPEPKPVATPEPKRAAAPAPAAPAAVVASTPRSAPAAGSYEKHETEDPAEKVVPPAPPEPKPVAVTAAALHPAAEPSASKPAPERTVSEAPAPAPAPATPEPVAAKAEAAAAPRPEPVAVPPPPVPPAPAPSVAKVEAAPQLVASSPEVRAVREEAPKPAPRRAKTPASEDRALVEAAEALLNQQQDPGRRELQSSFETKTLGAGERQYTGDPITLNLKDADIKDTLLRFSELTQLNIVLDPDVRGTVTISLQDIPWDQALELILRINQLGYVIEGNVMRIASTAKLAQEETARLAFLRAQDQNRPLKTVLQKVSYADAGSIAGTAKKVMSVRGDILVDARSNTLIIKELPDYLPTVLDLIRNLDTPNPQVMIETRIVEATRTFSQSLGIVWGFQAKADGAHGNTTGMVFPNNGSLAGIVALPSGGPAVLAMTAGNVLDTFRLDASLHAAEARGLVKVVSTPKVQTQTGETASIQSGFQIPVQTTVNNTTTVLYINATLRLDVTPHITTEGTIIMDVTVQKREPAAGINIAQGQNIPLTTRDAKTRLMVRDGGTAVIGGIFKLTTNDAQSMIPGLWKIPLIGNLFRSRDLNDTSDELMIFITPRIVR